MSTTQNLLNLKIHKLSQDQYDSLPEKDPRALYLLPDNHTHDVSIAASSGNNELTLTHGTKYALTAGGQSFIFTMPSDEVTDVGNHYAPAADSLAELTAALSGTAGTYAKDTEYTVLTGVKAQRDAKGHVTGITYTAQKIKDTDSHNSHTVISGKNADNSADIKGSTSSGDITLGDSGVTAGEYGPTANATPGYGDTFNVPDIKVNAKGIVTSIANRTVKIPASDNIDTKVTQEYTDDSSSYYSLLLASNNASGNDTATVYKNSNIYANPGEGEITAMSFVATSDERLKENFTPLIIEESILDLPTYKFDFIEGAKNQIGCKAQDLQKICPEIVVKNDNGYLAIQESKIVYLLLEEVKKLKEEVSELRNNLSDNK